MVDQALDPNVHLDEHERRLTVQSLDFVIQRRRQMEKRQEAKATWRRSELAVYKAETATLQTIADRLDELSEAKS